jgi:mannose-6-phosphate isomerase-like protein (cupin superfamily)
MDTFSGEILKDLFPLEKEVVPPPSKLQAPRLSPIDHWSHPVLLERAAYLRKLAALSDSSASETLREYPQHCTMLSVRLRSGIAELHEDFADIFYVLEGRAILETGGKLVGAKVIAPGEIRGDSIDGGTKQELRAGDVAHVAAAQPHQFLLVADKTVTCLVAKIQLNS